MSRQGAGSHIDGRGEQGRSRGSAGRIATLGVALVLALVVGAVGGVLLYLALGVI